jgi:antitoxin VapB
MALSPKDKEADRLARAVAALTGETLTDAVRVALAERLGQLGRECAALPDVDPKHPGEIVGYDEHGMW